MSDFIKGLAVGAVSGAVVSAKVTFDQTCKFYKNDPTLMINYCKSKVTESKDKAGSKIKSSVSNIKAKTTAVLHKSDDEEVVETEATVVTSDNVVAADFSALNTVEIPQ